MPLDFAAARCAHCQAWQVQRAGKVKPVFACKLCGAKQTLLSVAGRSASASAMRLLVQSLNAARNDPQVQAAAAAARTASQAEQRDAEDAALQGLKRGRWAAFEPAEADAVEAPPEALPVELLRRWARAPKPEPAEATGWAGQRVLVQLPAQAHDPLFFPASGGAKPSLASRWAAAAAPDDDW